MMPMAFFPKKNKFAEYKYTKKPVTMQITGFRTRYLPHLVNVALFLIITLVYFHPVLEGKRLKTNDNTVYISSSREIAQHREKYGEEPLWTNSMFGGMPAYLISTHFSGNLVSAVDGVLKLFKTPVAAIFLTMAGFYVLLLLFGLNPWVAGVGAMAFALSSYHFIILGAGHNTKAYAIAYMTPLIGSIIYAYRRNAIAGAIMVAWFLSLQIMANHLQITYYALIVLLLFGFTELICALREKRLIGFLKTTALLMLPLAVAILVNFAALYTTYEYGEYSIRGKSELVSKENETSTGLDIQYATQWSYGIDETMTLLIPGFKGGASKPFSTDSKTYQALRQNNAADAINQLPKYWGTQPGTDGPVYVGAVVFFLFVLGIFVLKGPDKWWLISAIVLSILLAWGKNLLWFTELFMNYIPGYNKFRAVSMTLVIAEFAIPLMGFLTLNGVLRGSIAMMDLMKGLKWATIVTGGTLLLFILIPGLAGSFVSAFEEGQIPDWLRSAMIADRKEMLRGDAFRSLVFVIASAALIWLYINEKISLKMLVPVLALLILTDMWPVNRRYLGPGKFVSPSQFNRSFSANQADKFILADSSVKRVLNLSVSPFNDATTSYYHQSIGGYHGAKLKRYQELIDSVMMSEIQMFIGALSNAQSEAGLESALKTLNSINMLNTKYIIYNPAANPITNPYAVGNAWFPERISYVADSNEELARLRRLEPGEVLVTEEFRAMSDSGSDAAPLNEEEIILTSYKPNELIYKSFSPEKRVAVFSEIYYPAGWQAYIDGNPVSHFRVNYILRGLVIPEGEHEIRFAFQPSSFTKGNRVSLAGSLILFLVTAGFVGSTLIRRYRSG